jgi:membrane protein implicated in regulation of membrane protease activity
MDLFLAYVICFGVGLVFTLVSAFMADVFGGHDGGGAGHDGTGGHAEAGFGANDMPGFAALSPTTIASFITAFEATKSPWISVPLAAVGGLLIAGVVLALFRTVFRHTQASSEARVAKLIGTTGTIITPIPAKGVGEIAYVNGGTRYTAPARSISEGEIANGKAVKITRIVGSQFYVEAI